jgi:hypothetical protein
MRVYLDVFAPVISTFRTSGVLVNVFEPNTSPHLSAFSISLRKLKPTNISTGKTRATHATKHLRNCDSGLIERPKICIARVLLLRFLEGIQHIA